MQTGAVVGSHTIRGRVVRQQLDILEAAGYSAERFIWIHTQVEDDFDLHLELARRGCWIEYDSLGSAAGKDDALHIERIQRVLDAGLAHRLLLSHDRGWYDPSKPDGGSQLPYTYLCDHFLPQLRQAGVDAALLHLLTVENPFRVFARW